MNLQQLITAAPGFYKAGNSINILSGPGVGKSSAVYQIAANMSRTLGVPFGIVTTILSGMDPVDIRGMGVPMKSADGSAEVRFTKPAVWPTQANCEVYVDGVMVKGYAQEHGVPENGILFFDEFAQADTDIQKTAAQIILDRRISEHVLPEGWVVWSAGNRVADKAGVVKTLAHVQNRRCDIEVEPDYEAWQAWAFKNELHALAIGFAKSNAGEVFQMSVPKEPGPYCTPRSLVLLTNNLEAMRTPDMNSNQLPDDHIAAELIKGWIGEGSMPKFLSHIRLANDLPDVEDVIKKPMDTKVPERLDARFVMATSLSVHAKDNTQLKPILKYVERMDVELQTLFVQAVVARNATALTVTEFAQWVGKNQKLILAANG